MARIAITTDTHLGVSQNTIKLHERFLKKLMEESFDVLVHTGDIASHKQSQLYRSLGMFREALGDIPMLLVLGNHDCLDKETELLTKRGWLNYLEILDSDLVLSINDKGFSEWTSIDKVIIKKSKKMYNYRNTSLDMCITENHRILCSRRMHDKSFKDLDYETLPNMAKSRYRFPVSAKNDNEEYALTDDEITLLGWVITDGHFSGSTCALYQSKEKGIVEIIELLKRLDYTYTDNTRHRDIHTICGKKLKKKPLPCKEFFILSKSQKLIRNIFLDGKKIKNKDIFNKFSNRQLRLFLHAVMRGDGSYSKTKKAGAVNGVKSTLDWIQTLAVQCGVSASLVEYRPGDFRLNIAFDREYVQVDDFKKQIKEIDYSDVVWCLNVPYTNFMVRRNGKAYFTGNCWDMESWNNKNPRYNKKISYEHMKVTQREWFEEFNMHYLQDGEFIYKDEAIFYGYDGWYKTIPPPSNDKNWMPPYAKMCPIDQYLSYRANKTLDNILLSAEGMKRVKPHLKTICATHHSLTPYRGGHDTMNGDPRHLDFLSENFDYVFNGHSHQEVDLMHEYTYGNKVYSCRVINVGSDYDKPKYKIIEI